MERQLAAIAQSESSRLRSILRDAADRDPIVEAFLNRLETMEQLIETLEEENEELRGEIDFLQWMREARPSKNVKVDPRGRKPIYRPLIFNALQHMNGKARRKEIVDYIRQITYEGATPSEGAIWNAITAMVKERLLNEMLDGSLSL